MLIGLFSLLFILLFGNQQSPYILPKVEKTFVNNIHDKDRKDQVESLNKTFMKEWKEMNKVDKKENKKFISMVKDRDVTADQLAGELEKSLTELRAYDKRLGDLRMKVQNLMTDEEWKATLDDILDQKPKSVKKRDKDEIKAWLAHNKDFQKLKNDIDSSIADSTSKKNCMAALATFEDDVAQALYENQDQADKIIEVMWARNATRDQIESITTGIETYKRDSGKSFIKLRSDLVTASDAKSWPKLANALADFAG